MRSNFRSVSVALIAVFAFGALTAASASAALPEFRGLGEGKTFHTVAFTGTSQRVSFQEPGGSWTCTSSSISGEITGPKEVGKVVIKFSGPNGCSGFCQQKFLGNPEWESKELKGRIGYISKAKRQVGLLLEATTEPIATCEHRYVPGSKLQGAVIGEFGGTNEDTESLTLNYSQSGGKQSLRNFEGEEVLHSLQMLLGGSKVPQLVGVETQLKLTTVSPVEIRA